MKINDVMKKTNITRSTILYYEEKGLIKPEKKENGYRIYNQVDLDKLIEIKKLRSLEIPVNIIKQYFVKQDKAILYAYKQVLCNELEQKEENITKLTNYIEGNNFREDQLSASSQLLFNLPGVFGNYLQIHFKYFLDQDRVLYNENKEIIDDICSFFENPGFKKIENQMEKIQLVKMYSNEIGENAHLEIIDNMITKDIDINSQENLKILEEVQKVTTPLKRSLEELGYYQFVPAKISEICPSYNKYLKSIEND